jgi:hypothetical protein
MWPVIEQPTGILYLGTIEAAKNPKILQQAQIKTIISVANSIQLSPYPKPIRHYVVILKVLLLYFKYHQVQDLESFNLKKLISETNKEI